MNIIGNHKSTTQIATTENTTNELLEDVKTFEVVTLESYFRCTHFFDKNIVYTQIGQKIKNILRISSASLLAIVFCFFVVFLLTLATCIFSWKFNQNFLLFLFYEKLLPACKKGLFNSPHALFLVLLRILDSFTLQYLKKKFRIRIC